jgi:ABC-2 type transport system ATP-binding protein
VTPTSAIEAEGLVKTYPGDVRALDGISFAVEAGTVFGLLGPNGAGKSTTVKVLTTLSRADAGSARVAGLDVLSDAARVRHAIGVVSQKHAVDEAATGQENLVLQGQVQGLRTRDAKARAAELLERFGLGDASRKLARTYSGGMQRRLDLAMGLVHRPQVLFLDEPTTGLDPEVRALIWAEISSLAKTDGLTILLTTHYLEEADQLASQLAFIDHGRVVATGSPATLKAELRGDAIHVELRDDVSDRAVRGALEPVAGIREIVLDGRALHARADEGAAAVPAVLAALDSHGLPVASVTVARPSLDDVYLRYTGRTFRAAGTEEVAA